ncbi:MAG TPA: helix-turn-helix domain-containing protein [Steroidobacteraceae bacterium]|nr:helix-turn-helix domain-containing protein [Steroidobacteraceae bacterium]
MNASCKKSAPTMTSEGMRYFRLRPDARLRPWIKCYWWVEPDPSSECASAASPDLLIPDGHSELVFRFAGEFSRWQLGESSRTLMNKSYVLGGRSKSVLTQSPGGLRLAGVKLDPRALRALLRMPLSDLRDNTMDFADLGCPALLELEDEIANLRSVDELPGVFDRFFLRRLTGEVRDDSAIELLIERIRATRGAQPILKWAREHGLDARTLERHFVARMGMTPKQFARVERFKLSYHEMREHQSGERRVHLDGFYDASHFDREFRHFLGTSPISWLNRTPDFTTMIGDHLLEGEFGAGDVPAGTSFACLAR